MSVFPTDILNDFLLAIPLFALILTTVLLTKKFGNVWINRKLIHLSVSPAILAYMYTFEEPFVFFSFASLFALVLIIPHVQSREFDWFQVKRNFGEVFFCISFGALSVIFWDSARILAGVVMLFMSVGDSVTGMVRSQFVKERKKHWAGTLAMLIVCCSLGLFFLSTRGLVLALIATIAEYQPWLDDNLSVPILTMLSSIFIQ